MANIIRGVAAQERAEEGGEAEAAGCAPLVEEGRMVGYYGTRFVGEEVGLIRLKNAFNVCKGKIIQSKPGQSRTDNGDDII